jgi:N-acetylmuramoyl-L-alanine amidase
MPRTVLNTHYALRIVLLMAATIAPAQSAPHKFVVLLDPAHGGKDSGAQSAAGHFVEKDVTLDFAKILRSTLAARNIDLRLTREDDVALTASQRAATAAALSPSACITLHATAVGSGVHVFYPMTQFELPFKSFLDLWFPGYVAPSMQSMQLSRTVVAAFNKSSLKATIAPAADPTLSRERCPAVAIELGPLLNEGSANTSAADPHYQQQAAMAVADALEKFRDQRRTQDANASAYVRKTVGK